VSPRPWAIPWNTDEDVLCDVIGCYGYDVNTVTDAASASVEQQCKNADKLLGWAVDTHTHTHARTHEHTHTRLTALRPGLPGSAGTIMVKPNLDFTEARDSEWQWNPLGHTQVCTSLQADNHASTPLLKFFTDRMPFISPNQQCQSIEGIQRIHTLRQILNSAKHVDMLIKTCDKQTDGWT